LQPDKTALRITNRYKPFLLKGIPALLNPIQNDPLAYVNKSAVFYTPHFGVAQIPHHRDTTQKMAVSLSAIEKSITQCQRCKRLRTYCAQVAQEKRRAYLDETYWGRPVPGFGDPKAELVLIGLAPAAHGANRTGRMFTGDQSGLWLYRALHRAGFANQAESRSREDGLRLKNAYVTAAVKCAPPDNKPTLLELRTCASYLEQELQALRHARVYVALGQIGLKALWKVLAPSEKMPRFAHLTETRLDCGKTVLCSYHPSQQNTFTRRLTEPMFDAVFARVRELL
jgi:uracil-DNA glycosylase family 4